MLEIISGFINQNLKFINLLLILIILFFIKDFLYEAAWLAAILIPYFLLTYKWDLSLLERALLSLPLAALSMNILYLLAVWSIPIPGFLIYAAVFGLPLIVAFAFYRDKFLADIKIIMVNHLKNVNFMFVAIIIIVVLFSYHRLLNFELIPMGDAPGHIARLYFVTDSLLYHETIFDWYDKQQLGYPIFTFDPPLSFLFGGVFYFFVGGDVIKSFNFLFLSFIVFIALGIFLLSRYIFRSSWWGFATSLVFNITPLFVFLFYVSGIYKNLFGFVSMPIFLYFLKSINKNQLDRFWLILLLLVFAFLAHPSVGLVLLIFIPFFCGDSYKSTLKNLFSVVSYLFKLYFFFFFLTVFFFVPIITYFGYTAVSPEASFNVDLDNVYQIIVRSLFSEPTISDLNFNVGFLYGLFFLASFFIIIYDHFVAKIEKELTTTILFSILGLVFVTLVSWLELIERVFVGIERTLPFFILSYSFVIIYLFRRVFYYFKSKVNTYSILTIFVLFLFVAHYIFLTNEKIGIFGDEVFYLMKQTITANPSSFNWSSRLIYYGTRVSSIYSAFNIFAHASTNGRDFSQGQHTNINMRLSRSEYTGEILPTSISEGDAVKLFRMTNTNYILFNTCYAPGVDSFIKFSSCENCKFKEKIIFSNCLHVLVLDSSFLEGSNIIPTEANYDSLNLEKVDYTRKNPEEILIKNPKSKYLFVKEEYFPRWHAFQEGIGEVPVTMSDLGLMIVENKNGKDIALKYELFLWEKLLFLISIGSMVILIYYPNENLI